MSALLFACLLAAVFFTLFFSTLAYALRDFSRARLADFLERHGRGRLVDPIVEHADDLVLVTAAGRLASNIVILLCLLRAFDAPGQLWYTHYIFAAAVTLPITLLFSVAIPHALSHQLAEKIIGACAQLLLLMRIAFLPFIRAMSWVDNLMLKLTGAGARPEAQHIEQEIMSVVEEGQKEGVVDAQEREMIESVIEFRDTQVGQIMSARPEIVALDLSSTLAEVKKTLEESGHSRIPVYEATLDHIIGILYARDLLKHLGQPPEQFNIRSAIRPAMFVPETKPLRDLLRDFRHQKVHMAIVADEYGGTAGLVTIEDILEELVGEIRDEHEPAEPAMLRKIDAKTAEADARIYIADINRALDLQIPRDDGYETLGGFVSVTAGKIPPPGASFEHHNVRYTVLAAQPHKVERVKIEILTPTPPEDTAPTPTDNPPSTPA